MDFTIIKVNVLTLMTNKVVFIPILILFSPLMVKIGYKIFLIYTRFFDWCIKDFKKYEDMYETISVMFTIVVIFTIIWVCSSI